MNKYLSPSVAMASFAFGMIGSLIASGLPTETVEAMQNPWLRLVVLGGFVVFALTIRESFTIPGFAVIFIAYVLMTKQTRITFYLNLMLILGIVVLLTYDSGVDEVVVIIAISLVGLSIVVGTVLDIMNSMKQHGENFSYVKYFTLVEKSGKKISVGAGNYGDQNHQY